MDPKTLYRQGVVAIRDQKNLSAGRDLLMQSLKLDAQNDMAWLWLTRTVDDPGRKLQMLERALKINPANNQAQSLYDRLCKEASPPGRALSEAQVAALLNEAERHLHAKQAGRAIEIWSEVLEAIPDHDVALKHVVQQLVATKHYHDARGHIKRAVAAGTKKPSVFLTGVDLAKMEHDMGGVDEMYRRLIECVPLEEALLKRISSDYSRNERHKAAIELLTAAEEKAPKNQLLLVTLGDLHEKIGLKKEALTYYDRAAKIKSGSALGRVADKKLENYVPIITDHERGSTMLALRETAGIVSVYFLLAWQDAGVSFFNMGLGRWSGIGLSFIGGYLLVTATSSPQQKGIARLLGGKVPENLGDSLPDLETGVIHEATELPMIPQGVRIVLGVLGGIILLIGLLMVFGRAFSLLLNPVPPDFMSFEEFFTE